MFSLPVFQLPHQLSLLVCCPSFRTILHLDDHCNFGFHCVEGYYLEREREREEGKIGTSQRFIGRWREIREKD